MVLLIILLLIVIIICVLLTLKYRFNIPKKIFTFWDSEVLPPLVINCINTWRIHNPEYEIIILNKHNLDKYIKNGSKLISLKRSADNAARLSDFVRISAIAQHGGVWMDATIICYGPLDNLFYRNGMDNSIDFFGYYLPNFTTNHKYPIIESWFFAARKNSKFVTMWRDEFIKCNNYNTVGEYIAEIKNDGVDLQNLSSPEYLTIHASAQVVLQKTGYNLKQILLDATKGPFKYLSENNWDSEKAFESLCNDYNYRTDIVKLRGSDRVNLTKAKNNISSCIFRQ